VREPAVSIFVLATRSPDDAGSTARRHNRTADYDGWVEPLLVFGALVIAYGARRVYADLLSPSARVRRAHSPRVPIGEAREGVVRLTGAVRPLGELLHAPVTRRRCVAFQVIVEARDSRGGPTRVLDLAKAGRLAVADESGEAVVDTATGPFSLDLLPDQRGSTRYLRRSEGEDIRTVRALLESENVGINHWLGPPEHFRYSEAVLLPGQEVSVAGNGRCEVAPEGQRSTPREPPQLFVMRGTVDCPLLIGDGPEAPSPGKE
jgi:hypothetical protein